MPVDREHAFAGAAAYPPVRWPWAPGAAAWRSFERHAQFAAGCRLGPRACCYNRGAREQIVLGRGAICRGLLRIEDFGRGQISLGENAYIGDDCLLSSAAAILVGDRALIAHGVQIFDNDSHPLEPAARRADFEALLSGGIRQTIPAAPVSIGADAWIGLNAIILKGVKVGLGSVVAAGAVVTGDVPDYSVVAGNPARLVKTLPAS